MQELRNDTGSGGLRWRSHPLVDEFPRSLLCVGAVAAACAAAGFAFGGAGYALVSGGLLAVALARYLLPTEYELNEAGARTRFLGSTRLLPWNGVRRFDVDRAGVHLSPFAEPSRLDPFRGMSLRFCGNADEVVEFVRRRAQSCRQDQGGPETRLRG
jgi:hypothetical protein